MTKEFHWMFNKTMTKIYIQYLLAMANDILFRLFLCSVIYIVSVWSNKNVYNNVKNENWISSKKKYKREINMNEKFKTYALIIYSFVQWTIPIEYIRQNRFVSWQFHQYNAGRTLAIYDGTMLIICLLW